MTLPQAATVAIGTYFVPTYIIPGIDVTRAAQHTAWTIRMARGANGYLLACFPVDEERHPSDVQHLPSKPLQRCDEMLTAAVIHEANLIKCPPREHTASE